MTEQEISDLLKRYDEGKCTPEELSILDSWYNHEAKTVSDSEAANNYQEIEQRIWDRLEANKTIKRSRTIKLYWQVAAAVVALLISTITYFFFYRPKPQLDLYSINKVHDIPAGSNKAILTLSNGSKIDLSDKREGEIAQQSGVNITKNRNGQIVYNVSSSSLVSPSPSGEERDVKMEYNTISTPNGGQYEVILPDGTDVSLNAASSLIYPTRFAGNERLVTLSGEAYFEVSKDPRKPFIIKSTNVVGSTVPQQLIRVLGTHFNVSCYPEEPIKTTLAEGKIEISQPANPQKATLKPGDQSIVSSNGIKVKQVNPDDAIGWKNGLFVFSQTPLREVMKQIGRWYDVDIDFNSLPNEPFEGEILRNNTLSQVLKVIERSDDFKFQLEGRRITINH